MPENRVVDALEDTASNPISDPRRLARAASANLRNPGAVLARVVAAVLLIGSADVSAQRNCTTSYPSGPLDGRQPAGVVTCRLAPWPWLPDSGPWGGTGWYDPYWQGNPGDTETVQDASEGTCKTRSGNPVVLTTGNKVESELDFGSTGEMPLYLERTYNHHWNYFGIFGKHWVSNFDYSLSNVGTAPESIWAQRPDGRRIRFAKVSGMGRWNEDKAQPVAYIIKNGDGSYTLRSEENTIEQYNADGRIAQLKNRAGIGWNFAYTSNYLTSVTHTSGRKVQFVWTGGMLTKVVDPDGNEYVYGYSTNAFGSGKHRLSSATLPGSPATTINYHYEGAPPWDMPGALTGKSYSGIRYSTFGYEGSPTGARVNRSEHAGSADRYTYAYSWSGTPPTPPPGPPDPPPPGGVCNPATGVCTHPTADVPPHEAAQVAENQARADAEDSMIAAARTVHLTVTETNPLNKKAIYQFEDGRLTSVEGQASLHCAGRYKEIGYDGHGHEDLVADFNGNVTDFNYGANGQLQSKTEAVGTPQARTTTYGWGPVYNDLLTITVSGDRQTSYSYNTEGRLALVTERNKSLHGSFDQARTTQYTYTTHANGLMATQVVDGPLPGTGDAATYTYNTQGDLTSVRNSLGHTTTYSLHNGFGQPGRITGPNGDVTEYTYDDRGRITRIRAYTGSGTADSLYVYNAAGLLESETAPDGVTTTYVYDAARRLTEIKRPEPAGTTARIVYAYNNASDIVSETVYRGTTMHARRYTDYNELSLPRARRGNNGQNLHFAYDLNDNLRTLTDSLGRVTSFEHDALNRRSKQIDARLGQTRFAYDKGDRVIQLVDPRNLTTGYQYDGFGQLWQQTSPDTGTTTLQWDAHGRRTSITRAGGPVNAYTYDDLGRVKSISAGGQSIAYAYDTCTNGKGRLCKVTDASGSVAYTYTPEGWLASQYTVYGDPSANSHFTFAYDMMGRLTTITNVVNGVETRYIYSGGQISQVQMKLNGALRTVASNIKYQPFGPISELTYGNGLVRQYSYDLDGRLTGIQTPSLQGLAYAFDANDLITAITNSRNGTYSQSYGYDELSRLTSITSGLGNQGLVYDANGNRTSHVQGSSISPYTPAATSNRLTSLGGGAPRSYTYAPAGNTAGFTGAGGGDVIFANGFQPSSPPVTSFGYDPFNRLTSVTQSGRTTTYHLNGLNQRVRKFGGGATSTWFAYDSSHRLLADIRSDVGYTDYIWLGGELIAIARNHGAGAYWYVHPDHLGRPELATDQTKAVRWSAANAAFDRRVTQDQISGLHIGFPGQYHDSETGLWYNIHRTYDPRTGRYIESDPIGLKGGINTYAYVGGDPANQIDPLGLDAICSCGSDGTTKIDIPINFSGQGATVNNVVRAIMAIETAWSSANFQVRVSFGSMNNITLASGSGRSTTVGRDSGTWYVEGSDWTFAHEAGHLMHWSDMYMGELPGTPAFPGMEGTIMGSHGGIVTDAERNEVIKRLCK